MYVVVGCKTAFAINHFLGVKMGSESQKDRSSLYLLHKCGKLEWKFEIVELDGALPGTPGEWCR